MTTAPDGKYYHTVRSGQNAEWIAGYYGIAPSDLLAWNRLTGASILYPGDRLLLQVTPSATATFTPVPATETPVPATPTEMRTATLTATLAAMPTATQKAENSATVAPSHTVTPSKSDPLTIGGVNFLWVLPVIAVVAAAIEWNHKRKHP